MLALTRKIGQSLIIGDNIEVTVVAIKGDQVKLAVKAPKEIAVHRKEIYQQILEENRTAAALPPELKLDDLAGLCQEKET